MTIGEYQALIVLPIVAVIVAIRVRTGRAPRWLRPHPHSVPVSVRPAPRPRLATATKAGLSAVLVGALPWPVYLAARPHVGTSAEALMIAAAIPVLWVLVRWARRRRADATGVAVIAAYALAVTLSLVLGGSAMTLKLRDVAVLIAVGLACLVSTAVRRPVLVSALAVIARTNRADDGALRTRLADPVTRRDLTGATVLTAAVFLIAAGVDVILLATTTTATFLATAGPIGGLTPIAAIGADLALLHHRAHRRRLTEKSRTAASR